MKLLESILKALLLKESVSEDEVNDAIDNHKRVIINYHTKGEDKNTGARVAEVYAYGLTFGGNPVIRVFQPYGDTTTRVPGWKFMRLDRISAWQTTEQTFDTPANERYPGLGDFNSFGDRTMAIVYKIAKFGDNDSIKSDVTSEPKTKEDVFKTSSETNMERLKQQVDNPINISDIKNNNGFKQLTTPKPDETKTEPKTKEDVYSTNKNTGKLNQNVPNTTEKTPEEKQKELDKLRQTLSDKPISLSDLNKKMKEEVPQQRKWQDVFDDQAEKDLKQMNKNDMRNQRRRDNRWQKSVDLRPLGNRKGSLNRAFEQ